ncbi:MAG TPA: PAS domain S-box protein [Bacillota bacterium]|nr:PAS domain S-box protein [Bacillota bacterium]
MDQPLQVLIVEDSENDAALLEIELQRAGYAPTCWRVDTRQAMGAALERQSWELVIADYVMPRFNGLDALALVKEKGLDLPFIIVSGHITDDTAVAAMKAGAHDYVMKDNLARLGPAVQRELREAEERRQRRRADEKLKLEQVFREAIENSIPSGIAAVDLDGRQSYVNPAFCAMVGWSAAELVGAHPPFAYWPPEEMAAITQAFEQMRQGQAPPGGLELRFRRRTGETFYVLLQLTPLRDSSGQVTGWVSSASDITERKRAEIRLAAEHAITRILANAPSLAEAAPAILQALLNSLEVDCGVLWLADAPQRLLQLSAQELRLASPPLQAFLEANRRWTFPAGEGLPGRVWQQRQALWMAGLEQTPQFARRELMLQAGLRSALAFPVQSGTQFFGVLELFARRHWEQDQALLNMLTAISSEIGQFIQRRQAEEALRRAHDELEVRVQQRTAELAAALQELQASVSERKRLEQELLEITEKERRRIGLDLHDDLGQKLSGIALMTKGLELKLSKLQADAAQDAGRIHALIQEAMTHASDLAQDLATLDLAEKDLPTALGNLTAHAQELFQITCRFKTEGEMPPLEANTVTQLYKITQEAVTNAIKHGKAKRVAISLARHGERLVLSIQNNGLPFPDLRSESTGMGLRIMNYRASLLRADLTIKGTGTRGTLVTCSVPLAAQA